MRHRSKTNSRPHSDPALVRQYREANGGQCEIQRFSTCLFCFGDPAAWELCHIFGGQRQDVLSNIVFCCREFHRWQTDHPKGQVDGKLAMILTKIRKREWNPSELDPIQGDPMAWVERCVPTTPPGEWLKRRIMEAVK